MNKSEIFDKLHQLPAMPAVVQAMMSSFKDVNAGSAQLARQIALDQGLSAKVLRVANSSFYGLPREIGSIQDAVTVLGFDSVRSLVLSAGFMRTFPASVVAGFDRHEYWVSSFRVATCAEALAQCVGEVRQLAFTAGMFHEVGQLVLSTCIPEQFAQILMMQKESGSSLIKIEQSELGFDHVEIGAEMARRWNFPEVIEHAIHSWRTPEHEPFEVIAALINVAVLLDSGLEGDALLSQLPDSLRSRLHINFERIKDCLPQPGQLEAVTEMMLDNS